MGNRGLSRHSGCPSGKTLTARHAKKVFSLNRELELSRQEMSKTSKCNCNHQLDVTVTVKPGALLSSSSVGSQGAAKASRRCTLPSVCARVFSRMNMPGTSPWGNVWEVSWPHAYMTSAGFFGSERAEGPTLSYFWMAELLALSICMNPATLQKNFGHLDLQTCYFGAYLPSASWTRAKALCHLSLSFF